MASKIGGRGCPFFYAGKCGQVNPSVLRLGKISNSQSQGSLIGVGRMNGGRSSSGFVESKALIAGLKIGNK